MMTKQAELKKQAYESTLKSRALSVLIYLVDRSNKELTCFPAIPTMARQLHISESTVKRALRELVEEGYIRKDSRFRENNRGQTSNLYTLVLFENRTASDPGDSSGQKEWGESTQAVAGQNADGVEHIGFDTLKGNEPGREDVETVTEKEIAEMELCAEPDVSRCTPVHSWQGICAGVNFPIPEEKNEETVGPLRMETPLVLPWTGVGVSLIPP